MTLDFDDSPFVVVTEVDLSLRKQYLDIVVIRKQAGEFHRPLPDGFAPLANHNLITFKSHQDTFDFWTLLELIGYYVNYRKQVSPSPDQLLPEDQFRLFGITSRFPDSLAKQISLEESQPGVYDISAQALANSVAGDQEPRQRARQCDAETFQHRARAD